MVTTDGSVSILTIECVSVTRSVTTSVHVSSPALGTVSVTEMLAVSGSVRPQTGRFISDLDGDTTCKSVSPPAVTVGSAAAIWIVTTC